MKKPCFKYHSSFGITIILIIGLTLKISATTYFVSNSGSDSNSGLSEVEAWKSLDKVNHSFFKPGDQILFKRGDNWIGTIKINFSGRDGNPITYGAFGVGTNPVISGFTNIRDWTFEGNGIYSKMINPESAPNLFVINGIQHAIGRFPNSNNLIYESATSNISITDYQLESSINWTGADVVIYKNDFTIDKCRIINHTNNNIKYTSYGTTRYAKAGHEYFIQNDLKTLDVFGEWYYDMKTQKLFVFFGNSNPDSLETKVSTVDNLIINNARDYVVIHSLSFEGSNSSAIKFNFGSDNCEIKNCSIAFSGYDAFTITGNGILIDRCYISDVNGGGIVISGKDALISNNTLSKIGIIPGQTNKLVSTCAITIDGNNPIIKYNQLDSTAYMGIYFTVSAVKGIIQYNFLKGTCQLVNDAGSIYLGHDHPGTLVDHNIVLNSGANGIYLDEYCTGVTVSNNTISTSADNGIKVHMSFNNKIEANTIYNNPIGINLTNWSSDNTLKGNTVLENIVVAKAEQFPIEVINKHTTYTEIGSFTRNYYIKENTKSNEFATVLNAWSNTVRTFSEWQTSIKQDVNSKYVIISEADGKSERLFYNSTSEIKKYYLGKSIFHDALGNTITDTFSLKPFKSKVLIGKDFNSINQKPEILDQSLNIKSPLFTNDSIGRVFSFDPDTTQVLNYSIFDGNNMEIFSIDSLSGRIYATNEINFSKDSIIELMVLVTDNSVNFLSDSALITINIKGTDLSPPLITSFSIPSRAFTFPIPIDTFQASDDLGVVGYLLTETQDIPDLHDSLWSSSVPLFFSAIAEGEVPIYAWAKDSAGNISHPAVDTIFITPSISQFIDLEKGWNIFSTFLIPPDLAMEYVLEDIVLQKNVIEVQNGDENTYQQFDSGWLNNIGNIEITEGYKIKVNSACTLAISGHPVNLPVNIELFEGWNLISFPYDGNVNAMEVVQPLIDSGILEKVQDERGESIEFWGSSIGWINGIGNFKEGEGYLVKVNKNGVLQILNEYNKSRLNSSSSEESIHFITAYEGNGFSHMNINIIGLNELNLQVGDEIAAFDNNICVGAVKISEIDINNNTVSVRASASDEDILNGFIEGNKIDLMVWQSNGNNESPIQPEIIMGEMLYQNLGSVFLKLSGINSSALDEFKSMKFHLYPNPAYDKITIKFLINTDRRTKIIITDLHGNRVIYKEVKSLVENLDIHELSSGAYLVKIFSDNNYNIQKLIIN